MKRLTIVAVAILTVAALATCRPADQSRQTIGGARSVGRTSIEEIELPRLICAVAVRSSHPVAISCVPNIPGMFEEPGR